MDWITLFLLAIFIAVNCLVTIAIGNVARKLLYESCLNIIQCYASFGQSRLDIQERQQKLFAQSEQARMLIREHRLQLLDKVER